MQRRSGERLDFESIRQGETELKQPGPRDLSGEIDGQNDALVAEPGGFESIARNEPAYFEAVERRLGRARRDFKWGYY